MQGTSLGMKAAQAAEQTRQFQTNLAERARQFDEQLEIQETNAKLRRKEFKLSNERFKLNQSYTNLQMKGMEAELAEDKRRLEQADKTADAISQWRQENATKGAFDRFTPFPPNLEGWQIEELNKEAMGMRQVQQMNYGNKIAQEKVLNDMSIMNATADWAIKNGYPDVVIPSSDNPNGFEINQEALNLAQADFRKREEAEAASLIAARNPDNTRLAQDLFRATISAFSKSREIKDDYGRVTKEDYYDGKGHLEAIQGFLNNLSGLTGATTTPPAGNAGSGKEGNPNEKSGVEQGGISIPPVSPSIVDGIVEEYGKSGAPEAVQAGDIVELQRSRQQP